MKFLETAMQDGSPLLLFSSKTFCASYGELQKSLPRVKHHYALKALPYEGCIKAVEECGGYLDLASAGEIELVKTTAPALLPRCIYTHPVKTCKDIRFAIDAGISVMVADNQYELKKLLPYANQVRVLLRVAFPNPEARCDLSAKFGAAPHVVKQLITTCMLNGIKVLGCCFHVGSQMLHPNAHLHAIRTTRELYDWCSETYGLQMPVLDIGGGFPARLDDSIPDIPSFCKPLRDCLDELFPDTEIWSEPGRCLAADCMTALSQIIGKTLKNKRFWYYLNDGVYNTFSGKIYDHARYDHRPLNPPANEDLFDSVLAGPTCDSIDVLTETALLPELEIGQWFVTRQVGAYGWASRTNFNQLPQTRIVEVDFDLDRFPSASFNAHNDLQQVYDAAQRRRVN
ncbi:MAG: type III PLP-dependent enzyme [Saprospiraceae bacterium]